ncbi:MAG TPA: efflux RND transporter permease subunit [Ignavibacteriaceae bacterium]|nr:efflux RND transporter permease subunit [Ignavibacteriaceae bacterium]
MSLSAISIRRPVLAIVMSIAIVIFGIIGYTYLGIREFPSVDTPIITVSTNYVGANADVIENQITEPLEESINGIAGIRSISSVSRDGRSQITVEFNIEVNLEEAANDVRDRVSRALRLLPTDVENPIVAKADADATPIVFMTVQSDTRNLLEVTEYANNVFRERFQTIPGVSTVNIWGEKKYSMRLWIDPAKLASYGLTPLDVRTALNKENIELPSGLIEGNSTELSIRTLGRLETADEFNNLIVKEQDGVVVRVKDIGTAQLGAENERTILKRNGIPMVGVVLIAQPGANNIAIADEFYKRLDNIKQNRPSDIKTSIGFDVTKFIRTSISEVEETILIAFGLVVLIIFLFLRDWRTTVIPVIAIPISLIGAFFIMYLANFSINVLTLLGIVLAIGIVVDDAIVVLENIYAKIEDGMSPIEASTKGSAEIFFAIISTTVALAAVFFPIIFLQGITGRLFREFGIVIAGSVIISAFVALTLTPMLSSKILRHHQHNWLYRKTEPFFVKMNDAYRNSLDSFLNRRWLGFVVIGIALVLIYLVGRSIPSELAPLEDRSRVNVNATAPEGTSYDYMSTFMDNLSQLVQDSVSENEAIISITAPGFGGGSANSGFVNVILTDPEQRQRTQMDISNKLAMSLRNLSDANVFVSQQQTIGGGRGGLPVQFVIQAPNFEELRRVLPSFAEEASKNPTFQVIDVNLKFNKPELRLSINREKARILGISIVDVASTIQAAFSGQRFGYFIMNGKQYQVIGQVGRENRDEPVDLKSIYVKNNRGELIQLDNVVTTKEETAPPQLFRYNRYVSATVSAGLAPGKTLGQGIDEMRNIAGRLLNSSFATALTGPSKDYEESSSSLAFAFIFALVLIYLVLAAQFESFRDPFIILLTVPLAMAGALISLWYFHHTLNIFSQIGIIMLIGLVTKNGILIVEFANQRKAAGLTRMEAIKDASASRLRPILMTSLSTILGTLPIALALGAGSGSRVSMGVAVVGGLIFSTFFTLYVVPAVYSYLSRKTSTVSNVTEVESVPTSQQI